MKELYLNTVRDCLTGKLLRDGHVPRTWWRHIASLFGFRVAIPVDEELRDRGRVWPTHALTMIGRQRLDNIRASIETVLKEQVPGCIVECGVWRGGAGIYMAAVVKANAANRDIYLCDSFSGLPMPSPTRGDSWWDRHWLLRDYLAVSMQEVAGNFRNFQLMDDNIHLIKGWFCHSLPEIRLECGPIAVLRCDGDMYSSTMDILQNLYDNVSVGGFVIIDDFRAVPDCARAVRDFRAHRNIHPPMIDIDNDAVFWRKE